MKRKEPINKNYCATVVRLDKFIELDNCDNVKHAIIFGNSVVVSKDAKNGDRGLFFPIETKLSSDLLSANNLYRKQELNDDPTQKGYFEENGRIRCVKFRGHKSEGFFIELSAISPFAHVIEVASLKDGDDFDEINGVKICEKYVPRRSQTPGQGGKNKKAVKYVSRLVDNQFRLHTDTEQLRKNISKLKPEDTVTLTYKLHGTSFVVGKVLAKKKQAWWEKFLGLKRIIEYDTIYSSRKVVKNEYETKTHKHFYGYDLWGEIKETLEPSIEKGITLYGEAVGYLNTGKCIQEGYDYGCEMGKYNIYIYRITSTNADGKVIEFTGSQVRDYCKKYGLNMVPILYIGKIGNLFPIAEDQHWHETLLKNMEKVYLEGDCIMCKNKVPAEGIVVKVDRLNECETYKLKSFAFLERETKFLDKGELDIESEQSEGVE
jgi:hypothetical protein